MSVHHSVHHGWGISCDHYQWCIGPHCTEPTRPLPGHETSLYRAHHPPAAPLYMRPHSTWTPHQYWQLGGQDWKPVQTYLLEHLRTPSADQCWHLVAIKACTYWNAFLFLETLSNSQNFQEQNILLIHVHNLWSHSDKKTLLLSAITKKCCTLNLYHCPTVIIGWETMLYQSDLK